ncbi:MAG: DUF1566 domain-containing protein [Chlorobiaceae bacterium]|jgi:Protein of unknown function (DUF1566)
MVIASSLLSSVAFGDRYGGGIVFFLDSTGLHGLVAAIEDISVRYTDPWDKAHYAGVYRWSTGQNLRTNTPDYAWQELSDTSTDRGQGAENTAKILAKYPASCYPSTAAAVAAAYRGGGYSDWFLPSRDELQQLYLEKRAVGGFAASGYWSSSENSAGNAWFQNFNNGLQFNSFGKGNFKHVRPVRSF